MNSQETMNAVKQFLTMFFSMLTIAVPTLATSQQYSALTTGILTAIPAFFTIGSIAWSIYSHWNMKKVPVASTAILLPTPPAPIGSTVDLAPMTGLAKVVGMLAAFLLAGLLVTPSFAAANKPLNIDPLHLINKPAVNTAATAPAAAPTTPLDALTNLINQIEGIQTATITNVIADITAANADASTIVTPATPTTPAIVKDPISAACYPAAIQFLQSLPVATPPTGTLIGVQLFQKKRDFIAQIQAGLPVYLKLGCAPLLGDEITTFVNLMAMVGVKILPAAATALMPALAPITLPALTLAP